MSEKEQTIGEVFNALANMDSPCYLGVDIDTAVAQECYDEASFAFMENELHHMQGYSFVKSLDRMTDFIVNFENASTTAKINLLTQLSLDLYGYANIVDEGSHALAGDDEQIARAEEKLLKAIDQLESSAERSPPQASRTPPKQTP